MEYAQLKNRLLYVYIIISRKQGSSSMKYSKHNYTAKQTNKIRKANLTILL